MWSLARKDMDSCLVEDWLMDTVRKWSICGSGLVFRFISPLLWNGKGKINILLVVRTRLWLQMSLLLGHSTTVLSSGPVKRTVFQPQCVSSFLLAAACLWFAMDITCISKTEPGRHHRPCTWKDEGKWLSQVQCPVLNNKKNQNSSQLLTVLQNYRQCWYNGWQCQHYF